jgi:transcription-repair coupling factor (superfamily II helicase)
LCGDVGFGKTELAIRAAFKCAMHGKQVAVIVPTTVLAEQHLRTFTQRISNYPMNIEVLSRFKTKKQQQDIIKRLKEGNIDIIIGTHRLLQDDVEFKDLGLLIIDEEQRFGVEHKERLKKLRMNVDVLTLTATPIPRTLHLALLGIRDISILRSPPPGRYPIKTEVCIYDEGKIRNAILLELNRKGQVFYVYNRVYDINEVAWKVSKLVPQARVAVGHGQMDEEELEETMLEFYYGNIDVLVSTAIIESGLDLPNANTIIVENADMFGLCDLHQLRGRVGRSNRQAYAYFFIPKDRPITPDAYKRLKAIEEFSEIGSGFKIATRDMQIRGVGNILGKEQHGHIAQVGYELYCRMLENAIKELKKEPVEQRVDCMVTLRCECYIPDNYISHSRTRIETYRKFAKAESIKRIDELTDEIIDKFGKLPQPFSNLINQNKIKVLAQNMKFYAVAETPEAFAINYLDKEVLLYLKARLGSKLNIVNEKLAYLVKPENCKPQEAIKFILDAFL